MAMAVTRSRKAGDTVQRVRRILGQTDEVFRPQGLLGATIVVLALLAMSTCIGMAHETRNSELVGQTGDNQEVSSAGPLN